MMTTGKYQDFRTYLEFKKKKGDLKPADADLLIEYMIEYVTSRENAVQTGIVNAQYLAYFAEHLEKPLREFTNSDLLRVIQKARETYAVNSLHKYILNARLLSLWLITEGHNKALLREKVEKIQLPKKSLITKKQSEILTREEVQKTIAACSSLRNRPAVAILYEAGLRAIEVSKLTWNDVVFDDSGAVLFTREKTGKERRIRIVEYAQLLAMWRAGYPGEPEGKAPVFVNIKGPRVAITYQALKIILQRAAKKAGIKKRVHLHLMRHSRITHMLERGISETSVKKMCWGTVNTPMIAVYEHVSDEHVDDEVLTQAGVPRAKEREEEKANICPGCQVINEPGARYCPKCGMGLTEEARRGVESKDKEAQESDLYQKILSQVKKDLGIKT